MKRQEVFPVTVRQQSLKRFSKICLSCKLAIIMNSISQSKLLCFNNDFRTIDHFVTVSKNLWNIRHGDKTWSRIVYPPNDVLFYQSWSFKMVPKRRMILCLEFVTLAFLIMAEQFGQNFAKMERICNERTSFSAIFWQISSDKICCCNWVAKFLIKGGGNFVQIGVSCLRGSPNDNSGAG